jgi:Fe-coproporphyrin III synthase
MSSPFEMLLRQYGLTTHRIRTVPVVVLMPHGGCNCRCAMCDIWRGNAEAHTISRDDLVGWLDSFRRLRVRQVVLSGGEPLLHPDLWGLCEQLRELPAKITLLTNGLLLEHHAKKVVRWCDDVIVSLDGPRQVHDSIRGVDGAFDRLAEGVAAVKGFISDFRVTGRCTIQRRNYRNLPEIVETAREIGLDEISFLAADVSTAAFNREERWDLARAREVALSEAEVAEFRGGLEAFVTGHTEEFASGFVAESPEKLRRLVSYFAALNADGDFPSPLCNAPWISTVIEADGTVRPCFFRRALGNIYHRPLEAVLNSPDAVAFRRNLDVRSDPICRKCVCTLQLGPGTEV